MEWKVVLIVIGIVVGLPFVSYMIGKAFEQGREQGRIKTFKKYFNTKEASKHGEEK